MGYVNIENVIERIDHKIFEWLYQSHNGNKYEDCVYFVINEIMKETEGFVNPKIVDYHTKTIINKKYSQCFK